MSLDDLPVLVGIGTAAVIGALLGVAILTAVARTTQRPVSRPGLSVSLGVALAVTGAGVLLGFLTSPDGSSQLLPEFVLKSLGVLLLPGFWAMRLLSRHSLDALPYFAGFALSTAVWCVLAYIFVGRRGARA